MPILRQVLAQWRIRQFPLHRRAFSTAVIGLSYGAASFAFHAVTGSPLASTDGPGTHTSAWILAVALAGMLQWGINTGMMLPPWKASDPAARVRDLALAGESVQNDVAEVCVAVLVTFAIAINLLAIVFALPFVMLLQRSFRHAQLVNASRIDSKTGLLNAGTWEREAAAEVARAVRTRTPLALALVDIDHFKEVNDTFGHLTGDRALKAIARTFRIFLRDYDLIGRFGGEEFALLLPHTSALDAYGIAERIREHIAVTPLDVGDLPDGQHVRVTVSMGVAALGAPWSTLTAESDHRPPGGGGPCALPGEAGRTRPGMRGHRQHRGQFAGTGRQARVGVIRPAAARHLAPPVRPWPRSGRGSGWGRQLQDREDLGRALPARGCVPGGQHLGVANPLQTHPCTFTGAPPPLPGTLPDASARA